ncbi:MAG TPA: dihydrofolate reductase [Candidatus Saccharimonadales bacterium]
MLSLVAAMAKNRAIGLGATLPWGKTMKHDIEHYLNIIKGKSVILGRKTYEHSDHARDIIKRFIVLSRDDLTLPVDTQVAHSPEEAARLANQLGEPEVVVTGGGKVYKLMLPYVDKMYLTIIDEGFVADTFFPAYNESEWQIIEDRSYKKDEKNKYDYRFLTLIRKK